MPYESLEFALTQYLDGTLPPLERAALDERLRGDAGARATLDEYRRLDAMLLADVAPGVALPKVNWDQFAAHLSAAVAGEDAPVRNYRIRFSGPARAFAAAACVLLAVGVGIRVYPTSKAGSGGQPVTPGSVVAVTTGKAEVHGPQLELAAAPGKIDVAIGPAPEVANDDWRAAEGVVYHAPRVTWLARENRAAPDDDHGPYR